MLNAAAAWQRHVAKAIRRSALQLAQERLAAVAMRTMSTRLLLNVALTTMIATAMAGPRLRWRAVLLLLLSWPGLRCVPCRRGVLGAVNRAIV